MTEVVDKTLIERLILEHSDRLELEINQKARADAWKFYYRVRVDHVIRPFAVCKVCFRVLHCDSRSGTASLLRHPCNPLSERSPVNRAVKLSAKLNLPVDTTSSAATHGLKGDLTAHQALKVDLKGDHNTNTYLQQTTGVLGVENNIKVVDVLSLKGDTSVYSDGGSARSSPVSLTTTSRASPTSTGSPPTAAQPTTTSTTVGSRKRKGGSSSSSAPPPSFPIDLRLLQLPQLVAAAAAHPLTALNFANATGLFGDPQRLQHIQQQLHQSHLEHIHRQQQQHQQQQQQQQREREQQQEAKRVRVEAAAAAQEGRGSPGSPGEASSSCWGLRVKKERADTSDVAVPEDLRGSISPSRYQGRHRGHHQHHQRYHHHQEDQGDDQQGTNDGLTKEVVQQLVSSYSSRITLSEKDAAGSHYISDVWGRFSVVCVDGVVRPFAACKNCHKVVTYTKYSGTGGLLRHRCSATDLNARLPEDTGCFIGSDPRLGDSPPPIVRAHSPAPAHTAQPGSPRVSPLSLTVRQDGDAPRHRGEELPLAPTAAMEGVARALLRYMCQDLVSATALDSTAFQRLVWTILNLGAAHGTFREEEPLPSARQLLNTFLTPLATDSRSLIARTVLDQPNLCLSLHQDRELSLLTGAIHFISPKFELRSYALGVHRMSSTETEEDAITALLSNFFSDVLVPAAMRDKHVTVVSDEGTPAEPGVVGVKCLWHAAEAALQTLTEVREYSEICDDVAAILSFLADSGVPAGLSDLKPQEVRAGNWDALLNALTFITAHHDQLCVVEGGAALLRQRTLYQEVAELLGGVRRCLMSVRDPQRPTLNQAVLCRAKLLQLCAPTATTTTAITTTTPGAPSSSSSSSANNGSPPPPPPPPPSPAPTPPTTNANTTTSAAPVPAPSSSGTSPSPLKLLKQHLVLKLTEALTLTPLHHVASFLDPRCKSLKVLNETEKTEVHRHVLEMMKSVAITEANTGVLNLKTTNNNNNNNKKNNININNNNNPRKHNNNNNNNNNNKDTAAVTSLSDNNSSHTNTHTNTSENNTSNSNVAASNVSESSGSASYVNPFREYMDNMAPDKSVSDSEEIMAYVNMKVHVENDDILSWWSGGSASGLSTLRLLARKILSVPATCVYAHELGTHARHARTHMALTHETHINDVLHMKYNMD